MPFDRVAALESNDRRLGEEAIGELVDGVTAQPVAGEGRDDLHHPTTIEHRLVRRDPRDPREISKQTIDV